MGFSASYVPAGQHTTACLQISTSSSIRNPRKYALLNRSWGSRLDAPLELRASSFENFGQSVSTVPVQHPHLFCHLPHCISHVRDPGPYGSVLNVSFLSRDTPRLEEPTRVTSCPSNKRFRYPEYRSIWTHIEVIKQDEFRPNICFTL